MAKPNKLQETLREKAQGDTLKSTTIDTSTTTPKAPTRQGKVMVSGWLPLEAKSSLRLIQAKHPEKLMQDLVVEAFNDLFAKYNVPQTAKATPGI